MHDIDNGSPATPLVLRPGPSDSAVATDHTGLHVMGLEECLRRVGDAPVGRLAFHLDGEIAVLPVNHLLDGVDVCFLTSGGSKIQAGVDGDPVSFEVDDWDAEQRSGWSVLVHGTASVVEDEAQVARLTAAARRPWVPIDPRSARWVRISSRQVTGRKIAAP